MMTVANHTRKRLIKKTTALFTALELIVESYLTIVNLFLEIHKICKIKLLSNFNNLFDKPCKQLPREIGELPIKKF
jgi:hypothetical protein